MNGQPAGSEAFAFDANGNVSQSSDLNGNLTCSLYDLTRNLETGRVEGIAPGTSCPANISTYSPTAGTVQRKILTQYHSIWHLPVERAEPLKITTWTYNGDGGVYCAPTTAKIGTNPIGVVCSRAEQATTDATGASGFNAVISGSPRVWNYTYNALGEVLAAKGPRTDVNQTTTYTYYSCSTGGKCGQIDTITDALGHVTTFLTYDGNGRPLTVRDPNSVITTLKYDARQRLKSRQVATETTSYLYYPTGLLETVTQPDSSTLTYAYDTAHRLTQITDGLGNYIKYTLDAFGNRIAENTYDPTNTLRRTHTRVFNTLSEQYQDVNAAGTAAVTTTFGYDSQGNPTGIDAPLSRNTGETYDALSRLSQITDPNGGITLLGYDANDNLASVKDPRGLTAAYSHDGFGDLMQIVSPDTGTTTNSFDNGGDLLTATDARGAEVISTYDVLNRVTLQKYTDENISYTYDSGTNAVGKLTGVTDLYPSSSSTLSWTYDVYGHVTGKAQNAGSGMPLQSVGYAYSNEDLASLTTPSGQTVTYAYYNHRITSITLNAAAIVTNVTYFPYGAVSGWTWGNGTTASRTYDTDGKISVITTAADPIDFGYDNAFRITGITDTTTSANSWTLGYDLLDRTKSAANTAATYGWTYDTNGNRLTQTGTNASTFTPATSSNQLNNTTGALSRTYAYDAAGNTLSYSNLAITYDQHGRASSAIVGGTTTNYIYDAFGQLIKKTVGGVTTLLMYDEAGHLLGEYTSTGALIQETVWMGDVPVATLRPNSNGPGVLMYYVHTDQLNAPRKVTQPSSNTLAWRWDTDPFGAAAPNQNPASLGTFIYNLRFPGQYYQAETGLNYNYARDYDPQTGRYIESDPIGLAGGSWSTYAYAGANPISNADPTGLAPSSIILQLFYKNKPDSKGSSCPNGDEKSRCKQVKNDAIAHCSNTTLPTRDYGISFQRCVNQYIEDSGCGPGGTPLPESSPVISPTPDPNTQKQISQGVAVVGIGAIILRILAGIAVAL